MLFDRNIVYGYTTEEVEQDGFPIDNEDTMKGNSEQVFTYSEICKMFPNQWLFLDIVERKGNPGESFGKAKVLFYKCKSGDITTFDLKYNEGMKSNRYMSHCTIDLLLGKYDYIFM